MAENITINMENLSESERRQLLKLIDKANETNDIFDIKKGNKYYGILGDGTITEYSYLFDGVDIRFINNHNACKDKTYMEKLAKRQLLERMLWQYSWQHGGREIEYNTSLEKFYVYLDTELDDWGIDFRQACLPICPYFKSREIAQNAIEEVVIPFEEKYGKYIDLL